MASKSPIDQACADPDNELSDVRSTRVVHMEIDMSKESSQEVINFLRSLKEQKQRNEKISVNITVVEDTSKRPAASKADAPLAPVQSLSDETGLDIDFVEATSMLDDAEIAQEMQRHVGLLCTAMQTFKTAHSNGIEVRENLRKGRVNVIYMVSCTPVVYTEMSRDAKKALGITNPSMSNDIASLLRKEHCLEFTFPPHKTGPITEYMFILYERVVTYGPLCMPSGTVMKTLLHAMAHFSETYSKMIHCSEKLNSGKIPIPIGCSSVMLGVANTCMGTMQVEMAPQSFVASTGISVTKTVSYGICFNPNATSWNGKTKEKDPHVNNYSSMWQIPFVSSVLAVLSVFNTDMEPLVKKYTLYSLSHALLTQYSDPNVMFFITSMVGDSVCPSRPTSPEAEDNVDASCMYGPTFLLGLFSGMAIDAPDVPFEELYKAKHVTFRELCAAMYKCMKIFYDNDDPSAPVLHSLDYLPDMSISYTPQLAFSALCLPQTNKASVSLSALLTLWMASYCTQDETRNSILMVRGASITRKHLNMAHVLARQYIDKCKPLEYLVILVAISYELVCQAIEATDNGKEQFRAFVKDVGNMQGTALFVFSDMKKLQLPACAKSTDETSMESLLQIVCKPAPQDVDMDLLSVMEKIAPAYFSFPETGDLPLNSFLCKCNTEFLGNTFLPGLASDILWNTGCKKKRDAQIFSTLDLQVLVENQWPTTSSLHNSFEHSAKSTASLEMACAIMSRWYTISPLAFEMKDMCEYSSQRLHPLVQIRQFLQSSAGRTFGANKKAAEQKILFCAEEIQKSTTTVHQYDK